MTPLQDRPGSPAAGFEGGISGLGLADLLQLKAQNRFSGCFRIQYQGEQGRIFFREGEIVHAEQGALSGEAAFCEMMRWPQGRFELEPNVVAARRTILKTCEHLLLDAHRVIDEQRAAQPSPPPAPAPAPASPPRPDSRGVLEDVRALPGVTDAVLLTRDGERLGERTFQSEVLAGQAAYLQAFSAELGALLGAADVRSVSVQGSAQHVLFFAARSRCLGVFVDPAHPARAVEAEIRQALSRR